MKPVDLNALVARLRGAVESYDRAGGGVPKLSREELVVLLDAASTLDQAMRLGDARLSVRIERTGDPVLPWVLHPDRRVDL